VNESAAELTSDHPERFGGFASLPLPDIDGSLGEIAYAFDVLKMDGVVMMTNFGGVYLGDLQLAPIFDELNRRNAVVYIHPTSPVCWQQIGLPYPPPMIEFPFDSTRTVVNLILSGTLERCPNIRLIISHAGGTLPFLARRIALLGAANPELRRVAPAGVGAYLRKLYYDVALSTSSSSIAPLLEMTDRDHVVYGSDYPFAPEATVKSLLVDLQHNQILTAADLGCIGRTNALKLFPRLA
jgi:predicted TIM-barrel fold metal-dependent hydrolase